MSVLAWKIAGANTLLVRCINQPRISPMINVYARKGRMLAEY
jgi:hypothetical protein